MTNTPGMSKQLVMNMDENCEEKVTFFIPPFFNYDSSVCTTGACSKRQKQKTRNFMI